MDIGTKILLFLVVLQAACIVAQHIFYSREIHALLNKLMSRDYAEYKRANDPIAAPPRAEAMPPIPEDLSILNNFQLP